MLRLEAPATIYGPQKLAPLYRRLLDYATVSFSAQDILTFLGRRLHPRFDGEVITLCKKDRWPGARIKHRMKNNWLKMYDKFGKVLRVETVINQPREFKVRRRRMRHGRSRNGLVPDEQRRGQPLPVLLEGGQGQPALSGCLGPVVIRLLRTSKSNNLSSHVAWASGVTLASIRLIAKRWICSLPYYVPRTC